MVGGCKEVSGSSVQKDTFSWAWGLFS